MKAWARLTLLLISLSFLACGEQRNESVAAVETQPELNTGLSSDLLELVSVSSDMLYDFSYYSEDSLAYVVTQRQQENNSQAELDANAIRYLVIFQYSEGRPVILKQARGRVLNRSGVEVVTVKPGQKYVHEVKVTGIKIDPSLKVFYTNGWLNTMSVPPNRIEYPEPSNKLEGNQIPSYQ